MECQIERINGLQVKKNRGYNFQKQQNLQDLKMGGQNGKQIQGQSPVQIDHPRFENARVLQEKGNVRMLTTMSIEEKEYNKWRQQVSGLKLNPEYLLMPRSHQFVSKGFCGSTGTLTVFLSQQQLSYEYFPYLLVEEIENRKKRKSKFQQCELWFLLFSLSAAQIQMKKLFECRVGDIRPQNIFINQDGQISVSCLYSWPRQTSNFQKTFQRIETLLAPEDINKLELGGMDDPKNYPSQMFSIGMTILNAAMLVDFSQVYDVKKFKFKFDLASEYLQEWRLNNVYSEIFTAFVSNLCSFEPEKRLTEKQLWSWINKYEDEIKNKEDFFIDHAPVKIQREIQQMRGQSNINILQENSARVPPGMQQSVQQQIPFQEKSIVFPFMQGLPQQRFAQQPPPNMQRPLVPPITTTGMGMTQMSQPANMIMSPRQSIQQQQIFTKPMMESVHHHNIPTAESMYTPIPAELMHQKFMNMHAGQYGQIPSQFHGQVPPNLQSQVAQQFQGQLPPGVIPSHGMGQNGFSGVQRALSPNQHQQYMPVTANMMPVSPTNGNFVYTRRIIDPTNNNVVAQQRIGQDEYQRAMDQQEQQHY